MDEVGAESSDDVAGSIAGRNQGRSAGYEVNYISTTGVSGTYQVPARGLGGEDTSSQAFVNHRVWETWSINYRCGGGGFDVLRSFV